MENILVNQDMSPTTVKQHPNEEYYQETLQQTDIRNQEITYWKWGKFETVSALKFTPIDLQKALNEMDRILWEHGEGIGFSNGYNKDSIHLWKFAPDGWVQRCPYLQGMSGTATGGGQRQTPKG